MSSLRKLLCLILFFNIYSCCLAAVLVHNDKTLAPFDLSSHQVSLYIKNNIAYTTITQIYENPSARRLEGTYIFPTPEGAKITEFSMWIAGKKMVGTVVERIKARRIYRSIVEKQKDPGILEQQQRNLFKVRVFPILPRSSQKFRIAYTQELPYHNGIYRYRYSLAEDKSFPVGLTKKFMLKGKISSSLQLNEIKVNGIKKCSIDKKAHYAKIEAISDNALFDQDFVLEFSTVIKDKQLDIDSAGRYAMINLALDSKNLDSKDCDITLVVDSSVSMRYQLPRLKIALGQWVENLREKSRFNIVSFDYDITMFAKQQKLATPGNKHHAQKFIDQLTALGPSNLQQALQYIGKQKKSIVVLISDGKATFPCLSKHELLAQLVKNKCEIHTLAAGNNLNQDLLYELAEKTGGTANICADLDELPLALAAMHKKITLPAMEKIKLQCKGPGSVQFYPQCPAKLYAGSQICLFAKFSHPGSYQLDIQAEIGGIKSALSKSFKIADTQQRNVFIEQYWEYRRLDHLLQKIRKSGENKKLVDEVIRLAVKNQVVTPYTAYLVLETEQAYKQHGIDCRTSNKLAKHMENMMLAEDDQSSGDGYSGPEPEEWILLLLTATLLLFYLWRRKYSFVRQ